ncbi:hypothetical protein CC85DRAFT_286981 [Cutaneotrichosporon oleaginosum]|uniref:Uncharacterized protein n=1 Tax=Cutaneotrichosporon oleaginosum TaxID=879819 RepID=A0A0J0XIP4_9TREE|nr:uncharacterized protein CC85DRAFT_286981 [Cutaneotrichosporon oleaginosum]KLT40951.1 hypothetical protein CC85DRAFT_286981 [Cutaneotrichosporon oleaginosum]TXT15443.1 hypothetical protein COLE_01636 [Cutaneotrichosporon oleaginosum]
MSSSLTPHIVQYMTSSIHPNLPRLLQNNDVDVVVVGRDSERLQKHQELNPAGPRRDSNAGPLP